MKLYFSLDVEGLAGVLYTTPTTPELNQQIKQSILLQLKLILEVLKQKPFDKQVTEITIADAHGDGTNLSYADVVELDDRISLISGSPRDQFMMSGLDASYDAAFLIGYHAGPASGRANLAHSFSSKSLHQIMVNGQPVTETDVNAAYANEIGVPVTLIVGDSGLLTQLKVKGFTGARFIQAKESLSRHGAKFPPFSILKTTTHQQTKSALTDDLSGYDPGLSAPYSVQFEFQHSGMADRVSQIPGSKRRQDNGCVVEFVTQSVSELINLTSAVTALAEEEGR